jgi:hypothetical protein
MLTPILGYTICPYGRVATETGLTKRAQGFYKWVNDRRKQYINIPLLKYPSKIMVFVGDYVYLPYSFMTMCSSVPFLKHASFFVTGTDLIHKKDWTLKHVLALIDFMPRSMMGDKITSYTEQVDLFLVHLREVDPDMWSQLIKERPKLDVEVDHVGRKALLKTVKPITFQTSPSYTKYTVVWEWDGEYAHTTSIHAYDSTWGEIKPETLEVKIKPADDAVVVIQDNAWVTSETKFVD